jgi:hypothetical protein
MVRCSGTKRNGEACTVTVEPPETHCWWHSPAYLEERRRAASKGGKAKANPLMRQLHDLLADLTEQVVAGTLPAYRGAVAAQLVNTRLRAVEVERKVKEQEELIERLERLERNRGGGGAGRWAN